MKNRVDILLVDDREDGLLALEAVLSNPRYNLVKAHSGIDALQLLYHHNFAIILLDVQMPGIDGLETAARIKKIEQFKSIPIIFVTAINNDESYIYRGYQSGAVDYIFKPFEEHILRSKVAVFVDLFEKSKKLEEQAALIRENINNERYLRLAQLEVESLKRYQNLADSIPHAIWRSKADGTMDYFNRGWTEYTGFSDQQSSGVGWQTAFEPEDLRNFLKTWMQNIGEALDFQVEARIRSRHGEMRWHLIRAVAECRLNGEIIAWLGTCTDINERKYAEVKLLEAQRLANAANNAKTNFLANMSHEIRTPLNSILGFTELMINSKIPPADQNRNLLTIKKNGHSLLKIIDEILDISKVEAGLLEMEHVETCLSQFFQGIHSLLDIQAQEKKLEFNFRYTTPVPEKVVTDPARLRQILVNIIGNSLKFTERGKVEMEISWEPTGKLRCRIIDTGIGIDPQEAQSLFQPFVQVDSSKSRRFGGTGLGLALSRKLAKALNGNVCIEQSEKGKGSTFWVEISAEIVENSKMIQKLDLNPQKESSGLFAPSSKKALKDARVLVVDDSADNRNLMDQFLRAAGAQVDFAADGFEGVQMAMSSNYQVVLMDIQMPNLDGYSATAQLRQKGYVKPIIALTAHALKQERENSLKAGCDDHLTKPIDRRTLIEQVARYI